MTRESYLSDLAAELHRRGVAEDQIHSIITEVESHLQESGEQPVDAFGTAAQYAEKMATYAETHDENKPAKNWVNRTFRATAFDEMGILGEAGREGWELVDVGAYALFCRRPVDMRQAQRWEYKRRTGIHLQIIKAEMTDEQWEPCGNWIVFHYFKRKLGPL